MIQDGASCTYATAPRLRTLMLAHGVAKLGRIVLERPV